MTMTSRSARSVVTAVVVDSLWSVAAVYAELFILRLQGGGRYIQSRLHPVTSHRVPSLISQRAATHRK